MNQYKVGDAVLLSDGRRAIITGHGIYEGQFWCEVADANGINLCAADYFFTTGISPIVSALLPAEEAVSLARQLKAAALENDKKFNISSTEHRYGPIAPIYDRDE